MGNISNKIRHGINERLFASNIYLESTNPKKQKLIYKSTFSFYLGKKKLKIIQETSQE